uniref:Uncharacterized protein n=1 Tax=Glossina austeni TaxID=7395 RepID=A0A1A9VAU6_GLOAU
MEKIYQCQTEQKLKSVNDNGNLKQIWLLFDRFTTSVINRAIRRLNSSRTVHLNTLQRNSCSNDEVYHSFRVVRRHFNRSFHFYDMTTPLVLEYLINDDLTSSAVFYYFALPSFLPNHASSAVYSGSLLREIEV